MASPWVSTGSARPRFRVTLHAEFIRILRSFRRESRSRMGRGEWRGGTMCRRTPFAIRHFATLIPARPMNLRKEHLLPRLRPRLDRADVGHEIRIGHQALRRRGEAYVRIVEDLHQVLHLPALALLRLQIDR